MLRLRGVMFVPMKIHVLSDLHTEFADFEPPDTDADVVVLAGDIGVGTGGIEWAGQRFADGPVLYVPGNHEYYDQDIRETDLAAADSSPISTFWTRVPARSMVCGFSARHSGPTSCFTAKVSRGSHARRRKRA